MKSISLIVLSVVSAALAFAAGTTQETATQKWEHLAMTQEDATLEHGLGKRINKLGDEGWELVQVLPIEKNGTTVETRYYFKRTRR